MHIDDETEQVHPGTAVYIPPDSMQFIHNPGENDLEFLCGTRACYGRAGGAGFFGHGVLVYGFKHVLSLVGCY